MEEESACLAVRGIVKRASRRHGIQEPRDLPLLPPGNQSPKMPNSVKQFFRYYRAPLQMDLDRHDDMAFRAGKIQMNCQ